MSDSGWVQLAEWGLRQHRQVTVAQLHAVGWDADAIDYRLRAGSLHRTYAGVYSLGGPARTDKERWMASTLTFGEGTRVSDSAAAELHGWVRYPLGELHVTTTTEHRPRDGIRPHHRTKSVDWGHIDHIPVTSPEQTILDCAGTVRSDKLFRRIVRLAQAEQATSHAKLLAFSARSVGVRGVARLRAELAEGPSPTRSANEDEVLAMLRGNPTLLPNHELFGEEVDLYLPERNAVIEVMSSLHDNPAARKHDEAKRDRLEARGVKVYWLN